MGLKSGLISRFWKLNVRVGQIQIKNSYEKLKKINFRKQSIFSFNKLQQFSTAKNIF